MLKGDRARDEGHNRAAHPTHCANLPSTPRERITGGTCDTSSSSHHSCGIRRATSRTERTTQLIRTSLTTTLRSTKA